MGFEFMLNFKLPYLAVNPSDFWSRWHISLSTWLRDYLYIPLGGNRCKEWKIKRNLMLTMVIGGLWHGAAWNFVLWGFYHGALLVVHRQSRGLASRMFGAGSAAGRSVSFVARVAIMFVFTCYGWMLFRAESFGQIGQMTAALMHPLRGWDPHLALQVLAYTAPLLVVQIVQKASGKLNFLDFDGFPAEGRVVLMRWPPTSSSSWAGSR